MYLGAETEAQLFYGHIEGSMISHLIQLRGNNGICNMRYNDANVLVINSDVKINSIVIDGSYVTGTMVLNDSFISTPATAYAYFSKGITGPRTGLASPTTIATSLSAQHAIQASQFIALSDARVKTGIEDVHTETLARVIEDLRVKTWTYKDQIEKGSQRRLGFIAQEIPEPLATYAIVKHSDFIPNIFKHATIQPSTVRTYTLENHELQKGDRIRFCTESEVASEEVVDVPTPHTFTLSGGDHAPKIFVYGKYATDVMSIDYDALVAALVASHQNLEKRVALLEKK